MVEFEIPQHDGRIYLPKELQRILPGKKVKAVADFRSALVFDPETSYEEIEESLKTILSDIQHRKRAEQNGNKKKDDKGK